MNPLNVPKGNCTKLMEEEESFVKSGMTAIQLELSKCRQGLAHHMACLMIQPSDYEWLLRDAFHGRPLVLVQKMPPQANPRQFGLIPIRSCFSKTTDA
jgi:hypothetical protein